MTETIVGLIVTIELADDESRPITVVKNYHPKMRVVMLRHAEKPQQ